MADPGEVTVNVTCGSRRLLQIVVPNTIPFRKFKHLVEDISETRNVRLFYLDDDGDRVCLDNSDEFLEALRVAHSTGHLQIIVVEVPEYERSRLSHRRGKGGMYAYSQLAQDMGERQRAAKEAAQALLAKVPCNTGKESKKESADAEPEWFRSAMEKHTEAVVANIMEKLNGAVIASVPERALVPSSSPAAPPLVPPPATTVVHWGVICDGCDRRITGNRYKCGNCLDYDLCDDCERFADTLHPTSHVFVKIKRPALHAGYTYKGKLKPLLRACLYTDVSHDLPPWPRETGSGSKLMDGCEKVVPVYMEPPREIVPLPVEPRREIVREDPPLPDKEAPHGGREEGPAARLVRRSKRQLRRDLLRKKGEEAVHEGLSAVGGGSGVPRPRDQLREELRRKKKQQRMEKALTSPTAVMRGHGKCLDASFVTDTSCPDGQVISYGKPFTKGWIVENSGTKKWKNVKLVHQNGFQPLQPEILIPEVASGEEVELSVDYPAVTPSDGVEIKSSWKLVHNEKTPFGCVLWLSAVAQQDPMDELAATFERISYPSLPPSLTGDPGVLEDSRISFGFPCSAPDSDVPPAPPTKKEEVEEEEEGEEEENESIAGGFCLVEMPTPVLSLASNDSFHQSPPLDAANAEQDDNEDVASVSSDVSTESEFVVVLPDCFNLEVPLAGFQPLVEEPPTPSSESGDSQQLVNMTVSDFEPRPNLADCPEPNELALAPVSPEELPTATVARQPQSPATVARQPLSPATVTRQHQSPAPRDSDGVEFSPRPLTLDRVWRSGARNPISLATGLLNTATNLLDSHVHFIPRGRTRSDPLLSGSQVLEMEGFEELTEEEEEVKSFATPPSTPPPEADQQSSPISRQPLSNHVPDVSRFLNRRWSGPDPPTTPMDRLIAMGFANRDLNSRLLEKHGNHLPAVLNELLDTNGDGYLEAV